MNRTTLLAIIVGFLLLCSPAFLPSQWLATKEKTFLTISAIFTGIVIAVLVAMVPFLYEFR